MKGVLSCPSCDDDVNTFYFGYISATYEPDECEKRCSAEPQCYIYTFFSGYHTNITWMGECIGAAYDTGIHVTESNVFSGVRRIDDIGKY